MDWWMDLLTHLYTPLGTTSNYSAIANLHTLQITTAPVKPFSSLLYLQQLFPSNGFNSGHSSASRFHVVVRRISRNWTLVNCQLNYSAIYSEPPLQRSTQLPTLNWLGPTLASIPHRPPSLLFTGWLSTDITNQLVYFTLLKWTALRSAGLGSSLYSLGSDHMKTPFFYCCAYVRFRRNMFTEPLLRIGCITPLFYCCVHACCRRYLVTAAVYESHRWATNLYATILSGILISLFSKLMNWKSVCILHVWHLV
jgi:hypothetical protein